jgi:hypothetical protein
MANTDVLRMFVLIQIYKNTLSENQTRSSYGGLKHILKVDISAKRFKKYSFSSDLGMENLVTSQSNTGLERG